MGNFFYIACKTGSSRSSIQNSHGFGFRVDQPPNICIFEQPKDGPFSLSLFPLIVYRQAIQTKSAVALKVEGKVKNFFNCCVEIMGGNGTVKLRPENRYICLWGRAKLLEKSTLLTLWGLS